LQIPHLKSAKAKFEPFYSTKAKGMGLGLAIVKQIVAAHGGEIFASRASQGGAEFQITLPAETRVKGPREAQLPDGRANQPCILGAGI
jgi:signal transduction histidine kinase